MAVASLQNRCKKALGMFKAFFENALLSRSTIDECGNNFKVKKKWYRMQLKFFHVILKALDLANFSRE